MSRRVFTGRQAHKNLAWESLPLVQSTPRRRGPSIPVCLLAFVAGLLLGLCF